jgi:hypothetical protein
MWAGLISAAAANKAAAAAAGVSVLLGGTVVEASGVGPAVRESVYHAVTQSDDGDEDIDVVATETAEAGPTEDSNAAVSVSPGNPLPGNLVTHVGPGGRFQLRGEIVDVDGTMLTLMAADGELVIDVADVDAHATGNPADEIGWADYVDYGVIVTGRCTDEEPAELLADCETLEVERVQLLGRAGQGGQPQDAGKPDDAGKPEGVGMPEGVGATAEAAQHSENAGAPDGAGRPSEIPPVGEPTNGPGTDAG